MFQRGSTTGFVRGPVFLRASIISVVLFYGAATAFAQTTETSLHFSFDTGSGPPLECKIYEVSRQTKGPKDRPLVIIEGLDLSSRDFGDFGRSQFEDVLRSPALRGGPDLWELFLDKGFDFYLVDFKSFDHRIEDLATLLRLALFQGPENIWSTRTSQSEPFVILGASIGGVIGRLALSQADQGGVNHHTRLFGSLDSPHKGAIIPLDIQAFVYFWSAYGSGAAEQLEQLHWQSVKQTLIQRQEGRFPPSFPTTDFDDFQALYQSTVPHNTRLIALSNGSATGEEQLPDNYGRVQFDFDFDPTGPGDFDSTLKSFNRFDGDVKYSKNHYGVFLSDETICMTANRPNIENAPGGYRTSYATIRDSLKEAFDDSCEDGIPDWCGGVPTPVICQDGRHCFVPLASALDLNVDIKTREGVFAVPTATVTSRFDALYTAITNTVHPDITAYYGPLLYEIGVEHSQTIFVDNTYTGEELGTPSNPFKTIAKANNFAWNGVEINIRAGSYPETVTFSKRMTVVSNGGPVIIGR